MVVFWQLDISSCFFFYWIYVGEYLFIFWLVRVFNDVLMEDDFYKLLVLGISINDKFVVFGLSSRKKWLCGYIFDDQGNFFNGIFIIDWMKGVIKFMEEWYKIGIILKKELDDDLFLLEVWVEIGCLIIILCLLKVSVDEIGVVVCLEWVDMNFCKLWQLQY